MMSILADIVESERSYVQQLQVLLNVYKPQLQGFTALTAADLGILFPESLGENRSRC